MSDGSACPWIDAMGNPNPTLFTIVPIISRGCHGAIIQGDDLLDSSIVADRFLDAQAPGATSIVITPRPNFATDLNQIAVDLETVEDFRDLIDAIAFRDGRQINIQPRETLCESSFSVIAYKLSVADLGP